MALSVTQWLIIVFGALGFFLAFFALYESMRFRRVDAADRRRERDVERERIEQERQLRLREQAFNEQQQRLYYAQQSASDHPTVAGDYFTFTFDRGGDLSVREFEESLQAVLDLPRDIAFVFGGDDEVDIWVHRLTYQNPLIITMICMSAGSIVGALVLGARRVNKGIQEIRRTNTETATIQAGYQAEKARNELTQKLYSRLSEALDVEDDDLRAEKLGRLQHVASVAAENGLLAVTHSEVSTLEAGQNREARPSIPFRPIKELGI